MDLSPNDIRNCEFSNQMRGYAKEEVDEFLDQVAIALETAKQENLKLSMEADSLKSQLTGLKQFEDTIKSAAIDARRNADMTIATAKQEADMILSKAKGDAENVMANRTRDVSDIENQITKLGLTRKSYLSKIRSLIQSHLEMVDDIESDNSMPAETGQTVESSDAISITQSTDVTTDQRESLANEPAPEEEEPEVEDASITDSLKSAIQSDDSPEAEPEAEVEAPIDPELAAALENYKKTTADEGAPASAAPSTPAAPAMVETTARAEDIPDGFVAMAEEGEGQSDGTATDKVPTGEPNTVLQSDPSVLKIDEPESAPAKPLEPAHLAGELDAVAAKLDETLDEVKSE